MAVFSFGFSTDVRLTQVDGRRWGRPQMWSGLGDENEYALSLFSPQEATLLNKRDICVLFCYQYLQALNVTACLIVVNVDQNLTSGCVLIQQNGHKYWQIPEFTFCIHKSWGVFEQLNIRCNLLHPDRHHRWHCASTCRCLRAQFTAVLGAFFCHTVSSMREVTNTDEIVSYSVIQSLLCV